MSITFPCPACGKTFTVSDELGGKKGRCKQCGATMPIPLRTPAPAAADVYGLDEEEPAAAATAQPRAATLRPGAMADEERTDRRSGRTKKKAPSPDGSVAKRVGKFAFSALIVTIVVLRFVGAGIRAFRPNRPAPGVAVPSGFAPGPAGQAPTRPWTMPALPERGPMRELEPGVTFQEVRIGPGRPVPGLPAAHGMTLYFYLPPGDHEPGSLPCVLVAPAGSILVTGMELAQGDQPEHLPYVHAGFAVLSYSLDGHLADLQNATNDQLQRAGSEFLAAKSGLTNARVALEWLAARVPEVDKERIYAAGHSSAGTVALLLAENEPRIKKCAAFAPRPDVESNFAAPQKLALRQVIPGVDQFFTTYNPKQHASEVGCPILLFHARDDSVVPVSESQAFAEALKSLGKDVTLVTVPSGDHHAPMISRGIPLAISWFKGEELSASPAPRQAPRRVRPAAPSVDQPGGPAPGRGRMPTRPPGITPRRPRIPR